MNDLFALILEDCHLKAHDLIHKKIPPSIRSIAGNEIVSIVREKVGNGIRDKIV